MSRVEVHILTDKGPQYHLQGQSAELESVETYTTEAAARERLQEVLGDDEVLDAWIYPDQEDL